MINAYDYIFCFLHVPMAMARLCSSRFHTHCPFVHVCIAGHAFVAFCSLCGSEVAGLVTFIAGLYQVDETKDCRCACSMLLLHC